MPPQQVSIKVYCNDEVSSHGAANRYRYRVNQTTVDQELKEQLERLGEVHNACAGVREERDELLALRDLHEQFALEHKTCKVGRETAGKPRPLVCPPLSPPSLLLSLTPRALAACDAGGLA